VAELECLNCKTGVGPNEGKIFAQVFVCPRCFEMAERLHERSLHELAMLQTVLREAIRVALVQGRLQFATGPDQEVSKTEVLRAVMQLVEERGA
jgi:hypothetical protein